MGAETPCGFAAGVGDEEGDEDFVVSAAHAATKSVIAKAIKRMVFS